MAKTHIMRMWMSKINWRHRKAIVQIRSYPFYIYCRLLELMYVAACPQQSQVNSGDTAVGIGSASMPQATLNQNSPQSSLMTNDSMGTGQQKHLFVWKNWVTLGKKEKSVECWDMPFVCSWQKISRRRRRNMLRIHSMSIQGIEPSYQIDLF